jgi:trimeric autotransporter adhesin
MIVIRAKTANEKLEWLEVLLKAGASEFAARRKRSSDASSQSHQAISRSPIASATSSTASAGDITPRSGGNPRITAVNSSSSSSSSSNSSNSVSSKHPPPVFQQSRDNNSDDDDNNSNNNNNRNSNNNNNNDTTDCNNDDTTHEIAAATSSASALRCAKRRRSVSDSVTQAQGGTTQPMRPKSTISAVLQQVPIGVLPTMLAAPTFPSSAVPKQRAYTMTPTATPVANHSSRSCSRTSSLSCFTNALTANASDSQHSSPLINGKEGTPSLQTSPTAPLACTVAARTCSTSPPRIAPMANGNVLEQHLGVDAQQQTSGIAFGTILPSSPSVGSSTSSNSPNSSPTSSPSLLQPHTTTATATATAATSTGATPLFSLPHYSPFAFHLPPNTPFTDHYTTSSTALSASTSSTATMTPSIDADHCGIACSVDSTPCGFEKAALHSRSCRLDESVPFSGEHSELHSYFQAILSLPMGTRAKFTSEPLLND